MNHIYKTVFNKKTGEIHVVSEKTSSGHKSQSGSKKENTAGTACLKSHSVKSLNLLKNKKMIVASIQATLISLVASHSFATQTYTGDASTFQTGDLIPFNLNDLLNNATLSGVIASTNGVFDQSSSDLVIDYTATENPSNTPQFIVAGYAEPSVDGRTESKETSTNTVTLKQGDIDGNVYSGLTHISQECSECSDVSNKTLSANENKILVEQTAITNVSGNVYAGYTGINFHYGNLIADTNTNTNTNPNTINASVLGYVYIANTPYQNTLNANDNNILIDGHSTFHDLTAGYAGINFHYGDLTATEVTATATANAYGYATAIAEASSSFNTLNANENRISINGNHTFHDLTAGYAEINLHYGNLTSATATATATATANASTNISAIAYSMSNSLNANGNNISIDGTNTFNDLTAGYAGINLHYGDFTAATANATTTATAKATANAFVYAETNKSSNTLSANKNLISIDGTNTLNDLTAGYAGINLHYGNLTAGNKIINAIKTSEVATLKIDLSDNQLSASDNVVDLKGTSTVKGNIIAGKIDFNIEHGTLTNGDGTTVTPTVSKDGTVPSTSSWINLSGTSALATHNTISIEGAHSFTNPDSVIYGGYLAYNANQPDYKPVSYDVFTGNTLNYNNSVPITIKEIGNFQTYNFSLNPELANSSTALITAKTVNLGSSIANKSDTTTPIASDIYVVGIQSGKLLPTGSEFILMKATDALTGEGTGHASQGIAQQGISLLYDVETAVDATNKQVTAKITSGNTTPVTPTEPTTPTTPVTPTEPTTPTTPVTPTEPTTPTTPVTPTEPTTPTTPVTPTGPKVNPQLKALLEGKLSGSMLVTRGADNLDSNLLTTIGQQNNKQGLAPFVSFGGDNTRYNSGSHIDSNAGFLIAGLSYQAEQLTLGGFAENGWDSYKTFNDFDDADSVQGRGHNRLNGVGLYAHYDFVNGLYTDVTLRGGRLHTSFETNDIVNAGSGEHAHYDTDSTYYGVNLTGGYQLQVNQNNRLNVSAKYLWSSVEGQDVNITGDEFDFNRMNSQRIRLNAENTYQMNPELGVLTGWGFEYEFEGKASGTTYGVFAINEPSLEGGTALASLGLRYTPTAYKRLSLDAKANGYFGKRDGGGALLNLKYAF